MRTLHERRDIGPDSAVEPGDSAGIEHAPRAILGPAAAGDRRGRLGPIADEAVEHALFRGRVLTLAREGLERYRLDLAIARFDLEATKREHEALRRRLEALGGA